MNMVAYGEELEVVEELEGWVKVLYDGQEAYVNAEFVSVGEDLKTALNMSEFLFGEGVSDVRVSLCEYAKEFLGNPYVWGGTSLTKVLTVQDMFSVSLENMDIHCLIHPEHRLIWEQRLHLLKQNPVIWYFIQKVAGLTMLRFISVVDRLFMQVARNMVFVLPVCITVHLPQCVELFRIDVLTITR